MAGAIFIPIFYLHHIFTLLDLVESKKRVMRLTYIVGVVFLGFNLTPYYITGISPQMSFKYWPTAGPLFSVFLCAWGSIVIYGVYCIVKAYRGAKGLQRNKLRYVLIAAIVGWTGGATNYPLWYGVPIAPVGNILVSAYIMLTAYAIVNYRLMEIDVVLKKTMIFAGIFTFVFAIFSGVTFVVQEFLVNLLGDGTRYVIFFMSVFLVTIGIRPLERFLVNVTDNVLFQKKYDYQRILKEASEGMTLVTDMKKLLNLIIRVATKSIRVKNAAIFQLDTEKDKFVLRLQRGACRKHKGHSLSKTDALVLWFKEHKDTLLYDEVDGWLKSERLLHKEPGLKSKIEGLKKEMASMNVAICIPSFNNGRLTGFLLLGDKLSGDVYTQEDVHLLSTLASEVSIAVENAKNFMELEKLREKERESYIQTVLALAQTVDEKDSYTHGHLEDVNYYGMKVAEELQESSEFKAAINKDDLDTALRLHDIGKIGVPDAILNKNGKLTSEEWSIMKQHCEIGARIVEPLAKLRNVGRIIKHHQEKYDGTGYPDGLKGEEIPLESRIISVVDAYHAMVSDRPYRKALPEKVAMQELKNNIGTQFDPVAVGAFVTAWEKGKIKKI
ncbi:MAG: HD domain-containing protein [Candidatus Omnitrophica bacterium]|nr:HD domain-containing protein [Candidatus Omnitrophota bacterium]